MMMNDDDNGNNNNQMWPFPVHILTAYCGSRSASSHLTSALDGSEKVTSRFGRFALGKGLRFSVRG
jgi:hypothetical protein